MSIIEQAGCGLTLDAHGVWTVSGHNAVSYPADGNDLCFQVEDRSFWFAHRNAILAEVVKAFPPPGPIVDVGGGNGFVAAGLQQAGFPTVVVEPGPQGALHAKQRGIADVICARLEDLQLPDQSLAACGMFDVLEHIEQDGAILQQLHRSLQPGGLLYLTVPAYRWLWSKEDDDAGHYRRYTCRRLRRDLQAAGFKVRFCSYFFWCLPAPIFVFRTLTSLMWRRPEKNLEEARKDHRPAPGWLQACLNWELKRFRRGTGMFTGSSCIAVVVRET